MLRASWPVFKGVVPGRVKGRRPRASYQALLKGVVPGSVKGRRPRAPSQAVLKGVGHAIRQRMMVTASGCVCSKHNMIDRDDVSVENTT